MVVQSSEHSINFTSDNINGGADAFGFIVGDTQKISQDSPKSTRMCIKKVLNVMRRVWPGL